MKRIRADAGKIFLIAWIPIAATKAFSRPTIIHSTHRGGACSSQQSVQPSRRFTFAQSFATADDNKEDEETLHLINDKGKQQEFELTLDDDDENPAGEEALKVPMSLDQLSEAFAANVPYFYLKNELGLSDTAMWRITYEASSSLGMSTAVIRHKVDVLRETMNLDDEEVRTIIERFPAILHMSADKNISPTILFLLRALELGREDLRELVVAFPALLSYSRANLKSKIGFFRRIMKYDVKECRELFLKEPRLLRAGVKTGLIPRMQFLLRDVEIPMDKLRVIVQKNPLILLYSVEQNLMPKIVYYFLMQLQMNSTQVAKLLLAYPQILDYNLERTIQPTTHYFINDLDFSNKELAAILLKFPRLFTVSLRKIKHAVGYFRFELRLSPSQVKRVLYRAPTLLSLNTDEKINDKICYLQSSLGLNDEQTRTLISSMPNILGLSIEDNLQPKLDFLKESIGSESILRDTVLRLPTLLGYSLTNRIRPRVEAILEAGCDASCITIGIPMKQERFKEWLQRRQIAAIRKQSEKEPHSSKNQTSPLPSLPLPDASARILHWTRERRPRPDV